ncbi:hypothetical protein B0H13DRAFT_2344965 [Mycena leptocephala]|nr:hypothetical protein B0H13DRAFT_2344965 [Mycena leptocephala]
MNLVYQDLPLRLPNLCAQRLEALAQQRSAHLTHLPTAYTVKSNGHYKLRALVLLIPASWSSSAQLLPATSGPQTLFFPSLLPSHPSSLVALHLPTPARALPVCEVVYSLCNCRCVRSRRGKTVELRARSSEPITGAPLTRRRAGDGRETRYAPPLLFCFVFSLPPSSAVYDLPMPAHWYYIRCMQFRTPHVATCSREITARSWPNAIRSSK